MADIQHSNLSDDLLHYPKGASTAANNTWLKANGDGTTVFSSLPEQTLAVQDNIISLSSANQEMATVGDTLRVKYAGVLETSPGGSVTVSPDGTITFNDSGVYAIELALNAGRTNNAGVTTIAVTSTFNGIYSSSSRTISLDSADETFSLSANFSGTFQATAGDVLTIELLRVSNGSGSAGLYPTAIANPNFNDVPSSHLSITKLGV